jgi:hypothetical protein
MAGFPVLAEARIHFRSYKSAEFLFRGGTTRWLINKLGLDRDQEDKVQNFARKANVQGVVSKYGNFLPGRVSAALVVANAFSPGLKSVCENQDLRI